MGDIWDDWDNEPPKFRNLTGKAQRNIVIPKNLSKEKPYTIFGTGEAFETYEEAKSRADELVAESGKKVYINVLVAIISPDARTVEERLPVMLITKETVH